MKTSHVTAVLLVVTLTFAGCYAGPGHTRAAGAGIGTGTGAVMGAMIGSATGDELPGALLGGVLGYVAGSTVGEGIARDQEMYNSPRHRGGDAIAAQCPNPQPRVIQRRVLRPRTVTVYDEVIVEEVVPPYAGR